VIEMHSAVLDLEAGTATIPWFTVVVEKDSPAASLERRFMALFQEAFDEIRKHAVLTIP
jgi:hypothetical protein